MTITPSSLAAVNGVGVKNSKFAVTASVLPQKNVIIGTYDQSTYTDIVPNVPIRVFSAAQVGGLTGYGFMLHRLARALFRGGVSETWIIPQTEIGSPPTCSTGSINFAGTAITAAGTIALYIAGDLVDITVAIGDDHTDVSDALAAAITADDELPVTATSLAGVLTLTSKSGGEWGDDIDISFNLADDDEDPAGLVAVITDMAGGAGTPDIQDALDALGIDYVHCPELGIDSKHRVSLESQDDYDQLFSAYENTTLKNNYEGILRLDKLLKKKKRIAVTCFEKLPQQCHRTRVANSILELNERLKIIEV